MTSFKIVLAYDGTQFVGWQRQAAGTSIQGLLEDALRALADGAPERFCVLRMLQDQRALQIPRTVQPGRESEMPLEQRAGTAEQIKEVGRRSQKEKGKRKKEKGKRKKEKGKSLGKVKANGQQIVPYG